MYIRFLCTHCRQHFTYLGHLGHCITSRHVPICVQLPKMAKVSIVQLLHVTVVNNVREVQVVFTQVRKPVLLVAVAGDGNLQR